MELVLMLAVTLDCILCHVVGPGYQRVGRLSM